MRNEDELQDDVFLQRLKETFSASVDIKTDDYQPSHRIDCVLYAGKFNTGKFLIARYADEILLYLSIQRKMILMKQN